MNQFKMNKLGYYLSNGKTLCKLLYKEIISYPRIEPCQYMQDKLNTHTLFVIFDFIFHEVYLVDEMGYPIHRTNSDWNIVEYIGEEFPELKKEIENE